MRFVVLPFMRTIYHLFRYAAVAFQNCMTGARSASNSNGGGFGPNQFYEGSSHNPMQAQPGGPGGAMPAAAGNSWAMPPPRHGDGVAMGSKNAWADPTGGDDV